MRAAAPPAPETSAPASSDGKGRHPLLLRRALLLAATLALTVLGLVPEARAAWFFPPWPTRSKDFTVIKHDGLYHIFYISNDPRLPVSIRETEFGHSTSPDLFIWTTRPPVVGIRPGEWDRSHVWAPSIVERDGLFYLFYTGVADDGGASTYQQMGLAISTDLMTWNRVDDPVLSCGQVPWAACDSTNGSVAFRDPFVMADPTVPGRWLMLYSATPASDPGSMIAGLAASSGDFTQWTDLQPLWISHGSWNFHSRVESPHLFEHGGLWYLVFTTESGQPLRVSTATNIFAPPINWTRRGNMMEVLGYDTATWYASEYLRDGGVDYFVYVDGEWVVFKKMVWGSDWRFSLAEPDPFHVVSMRWGSEIATPGSYVPLTIATTWGFNRTLQLEAVATDAAGHETILDPESIGLPRSIAVTGDTMTVWWVPSEAPTLDNGEIAQDIRVRVPDRTCESQPVVINSDPDPPQWMKPPSSGPVGRPKEDGNPDGGIPGIRLMPRARAAGSADLLIEMPKESAARVDLFDLQGRRLRTLADRVLPKGPTLLGWDGRDESGVPLGRGIYFARLTSGGSARTVRVLLR